MNIAVNTRLLLPGRLEGIGWFTHEILRRWVCAHPEHTFYFLFDRKPDPAFVFAPNVQPVVLFPPARHPYLWYWFFEWSVPRFLKKHPVDLFVSTDGWMPLHATDAAGRPIPCVDVIHDLSFEHDAAYVSRPHGRYYRRFFPLFAHRADLLCTVSDFSRRDIAARYGLPAERIEVVYNAAMAAYHPIPEAEKAAVRASLTGGCPFFIYVGSIHKRKNVWRMLQAFDRFKAGTGLNHRFVLVGTPMWRDRRMEKAYASLACARDIVWAGRVEPETLNGWVAAADAMVYVSEFEGFGIPIVEAMAAETAVITSDVTSMPEVGGDAACYVNPYEVASIADGMARVAGDAAYRADLIERGRLQREKFSWDGSARRFDEAVGRLMSGR